MAYLSPDYNNHKDDEFIMHIRELSKASGIVSPATPATLDSLSSSKACLEARTPDDNHRKSGKSIADLIDTAFVQSPDESVFFIYDDDENAKSKSRTQKKQAVSYERRASTATTTTTSTSMARRRSGDNDDDHRFDTDLTHFQPAPYVFGDFSDDPFPTNLSALVDQFAKVIEAEEQFVQLYKRNFQLDPSSTRQALAEKGFKFQKAKMVSMLSSKALRAAVKDDEGEGDDDEACSRLCLDSSASRLCLDSSSSQLHHDDLSVVMSICTARTGQTATSDATSITAARLMKRVMDPSDHDSEVSKEIRKLSPSELAARFVEMQEKLHRKQQKKAKKKKKKKKSKKKKKVEEDVKVFTHPVVHQGIGQQPKSILKKSSRRDVAVSDLDDTHRPTSGRSRSLGRSGEEPPKTNGKKDSSAGHDGRDGGAARIANNSASTPPQHDFRSSRRDTAGRSPTPRSSETPPSQRSRRHVFSLPPRRSNSSSRCTPAEASGSGLESQPVAKKSLWTKLFKPVY
ncbi:hypothetical protein MHU86_17988 [Fragilaria crotonensis]|nr:hypothetical protein MHU86_17988 [Fragilaria crotonensis]